MTQPTERRFVMEPRLDAEVQALEAVDATKAPLASPTLTGTPTSTTAAVDTSTTQIATTAFVTNQAAAATSPMNGTAAVGTSKRYARQDHVHPTDTTRAPLASPTFTGTPAAPTAAADTNTTQVATTAYVVGQASSTSPVMDGTAAAGTSLKYARADHVHPTDTSRAPAAGSSSITTVGTISSGTWQGTDVALAYGGTNATLTAVNGGVVYSNATAMAITAVGTTGQVLKSNGAAAPTWQTNNLDSLSDVVITSPTAGQTLAYNGTNWINGSGGGGGVTASATAPASPVNGSAWFDTNDGTLYVYYTDANSSQWVEVQADSALGSQLTTRMSTAESNITALQSASPNYLINGGFDIWQRGTSGAPTSSATAYVADRWETYRAGYATGMTVSRQASGLTGFQYCMRVQRDSSNTSTASVQVGQALETNNSVTLAGKTVVLSFYARAGANFSASGGVLGAKVSTGTGTDQSLRGGFTGYASPVQGNAALTTSWQRFSFTGTLSSSANQAAVELSFTPSGTAGAADFFEVTGVQVEVGSVATAFRRNAPSIQAELAACQRYYLSMSGNITNGYKTGADTFRVATVYFPVQMRIAPSVSATWSDSTSAASNGTNTLSTIPVKNMGNTTTEIILTSLTANAEL